MEKIRDTLMQQLENKGADNPHFINLVDTYMFYTEQIEEMKKDIIQNGFTVNYISNRGKDSEKENPCVKNIVMFDKIRLSILKDLGITTKEIASNVEDEL